MPAKFLMWLRNLWKGAGVAGEHTLQLCVPAVSGEGKKDEGENV